MNKKDVIFLLRKIGFNFSSAYTGYNNYRYYIDENTFYTLSLINKNNNRVLFELKITKYKHKSDTTNISSTILFETGIPSVAIEKIKEVFKSELREIKINNVLYENNRKTKSTIH